MEENPIASLTLRMQRLERECRRLRWLGISVVLSAILVFFIGGARYKTWLRPVPRAA